jgi:enoyl-CoA hydratase/carnithine racemase
LPTEPMETLSYERDGHVGWITLDRPEALNAFNSTMLRELADLYSRLARDDEVHAIVLTGAGDRAFCTGVDREEAADPIADGGLIESWPDSPFIRSDVGEWLGPKTRGLWKPMIAAVNGMACGGAFYLLGEVEFIIAAENATFFDPHVSYGITAAYEPIHMLQKMPFHEVMRLTLLGNRERLSAQRAYEIGLVSEVVPADQLRERASWAAQAIAASPPRAVQATLRAVWAARELSRSQALSMAYAFVGLGNVKANYEEGEQVFSSGERLEWRLR